MVSAPDEICLVIANSSPILTQAEWLTLQLVALKIWLCQFQEPEAHDTAFLMTFFECFEKGDIMEELLEKGLRLLLPHFIKKSANCAWIR